MTIAAQKPESTGRSPARAAWRFLTRHALIHLLLLAGVGIFSFPFVWMVGMSLKTDEEAGTTDFFPHVPTFRQASPFVRDLPAPELPPGVDEDRWDALQPALRAAARTFLAEAHKPMSARDVDQAAYTTAAADQLIGRVAQRLPRTVWAGEDTQASRDSLLDAFRKAATVADAQSVWADQLGRLELRGLQVRTLDAHIFNLIKGGDIAGAWQVIQGDAKLIQDGPDASYLRYKFDTASAKPIVLRYAFEFPMDPKDLHKLMLPLNNDDSWHRVSARLQVGGQAWQSGMPYYISQYRGGSIVWQPPTFDEQTFQPKTWYPLESAAVATPLPGRSAVLELTIEPSSTTAAVYGKVQKNYTRAFRSVPFFKYVSNSLILVVMEMGGVLFSSSFVAYAFARLHWPGRGVALGILLATMMLPGQVTMIPSFLIWQKLGWYNTLNPLWVGSWFGNAFFIFLMTQSMKTIPKELEEAARIDGLNAIQTWWYIILPQVKPTLAAIAIMSFMGTWNNFMGPLILLRDQAKFPLSLGLFGLQLAQGSDWPLVMAGNLIMTLPVVLIFLVFQRYFIEGVTATGMKG